MNGGIPLKGGTSIVTHDNADAWRVSIGNVLVYVAPWRNNALGRRAFLYEAMVGETVPSLCIKDYEHTEWRFCFVAVDTAELSVIKGGNTSVLRSSFSERVKLHYVEREGFNSAVINFYKLTIVAEDGLIHKTLQDHKTTSENILKLIFNIFSKKQLKLEAKQEG